jgi:hypothetical protein
LTPILTLTRSCDLEQQAKWRTGPGDPSGKIIPADYLLPNFERVAIHSSGLEPIYIKAVFRAVKKGRTEPKLREYRHSRERDGKV